MKLYHLTKRANLSNIMLVGLRLEYCGKKGLSRLTRNPPRIFLTDNPNVPARQGMVSTENMSEWSLLAVDCEGLDVHHHLTSYDDSPKPIPNEFVVYSDIEPDRLQILDIESMFKGEVAV